MCLHPHTVPSIPEETARVAHAAFRKGTVFMRMRDAFGPFYTDEDFASLFPSRAQSAESPWRLALVTVMQYVGSPASADPALPVEATATRSAPISAARASAEARSFSEPVGLTASFLIQRGAEVRPRKRLI